MGKRDIWEKLSALIIVAFAVWFVWSWLEVIAHNRTDCQYSAWNMWVLVLRMCNVGGGI